MAFKAERAAAAMARRERVAALGTPRPLPPRAPWNNSCNLYSKKVSPRTDEEKVAFKAERAAAAMARRDPPARIVRVSLAESWALAA